MSFSLTAAGAVPATAPDGTLQDTIQAEAALYEALKVVLSNPAFGVTSSSFGGSHVSGSLHLADSSY